MEQSTEPVREPTKRLLLEVEATDGTADLKKSKMIIDLQTAFLHLEPKYRACGKKATGLGELGRRVAAHDVAIEKFLHPTKMWSRLPHH